MIVVVIVAAVLVVVGVGALLSYNRFVRQRQLVDNSWSNVDTELKRRYDLIPNLVATVEGYAAHERATLDAGCWRYASRIPISRPTRSSWTCNSS